MAVRWSEVEIGHELPPFRLAFPLRRVIMTPGVTLDYFPGHFDLDYAKSIGHPSVFVNTMPLFGLVDRLVTDWAGGATAVVRHRIKLRVPVYADDEVEVAGRVAAKGDGGLVDVEVTVAKDGGATVCCEGAVTARLAG